MDGNSLSKIYDDFFGSSLLTDQSNFKKIEEVNEEIDMDNLLLDEKSVELLKKIVLYMDNYNNSKTTNYISFNIKLNCDNKETINKVISILKSKSGGYIINSSSTNLSLFTKISFGIKSSSSSSNISLFAIFKSLAFTI